jgi:hypothetical protein
MDQKFSPTTSVMRRNPDKYMRNPTKVFASTHFSKKFALYDLPGYQKQTIGTKKNSLSPDLAASMN